MTDILDELQWRGLIAQHTDIDALRAALNEGSVTFYCGFDPTAPSLHHGHLVAVKVMRHLQMAGHHPLALVGGATGLIGDPRAKGERSLNTKDVVAGWARSLQAQLENLLDFEGDNPARIVNNLDWTGQMTAVDFLRDLGKHFRMGTMLSKAMTTWSSSAATGAPWRWAVTTSGATLWAAWTSSTRWRASPCT